MALEFQRQVSRRSGNDFYKIDRSRGKDQKGTGLGLAIVKEILHAHGQHINVISTEGVGTEFTFYIRKRQSREFIHFAFYRLYFFLIPTYGYEAVPEAAYDQNDSAAVPHKARLPLNYSDSVNGSH